MSLNQPIGVVYLVGAGPGDPALLSLRAHELLLRADVVYYDYLVNPVIATYANKRARLVCLGRHGRQRIWSQDEINRSLVEDARLGRTVVRLKGGDPAIFGRLASEASHLQEQGIPFEVVPGVTAASAATAYVGALLTSRQNASAVAFVTGHELQGKAQAVDFTALAKFPGTIVVYMGVTTSKKWVGELIAAGMSSDTPVKLARRCSFPDQQSLTCTLGEVPDRLTPYSKFPPPVLAIIGPVVEQDVGIQWYEKLPLRGQTVIVTRPTGQHLETSGKLAELGAYVMYQPAIQIGPALDQQALRSVVGRVGEFDWIVFSSANGVRYFLDEVFASGKDARALGSARIACIGPATASAMKPYGLTSDLTPDSYRAEALASALLPEVAQKRVLLIRASRGREVLSEALASITSALEQIVAYHSSDVTEPEEDVLAAFDGAGQRAPWVTVTSSAIARSLDGMLRDRLKRARLVSISPVTSKTLEELGHHVEAEARTYDSDGMIEAILNAVRATE